MFRLLLALSLNITSTFIRQSNKNLFLWMAGWLAYCDRRSRNCKCFAAHGTFCKVKTFVAGVD